MSATRRPLLSPAPAAGFDEPVEMLHACHARTRQRIDLLGRLSAHLAAHGVDAGARDAARDVMRFFDIAAVHHHEDEERHVLPALRAAGRGTLADRLQADHDAMREAWRAVRDDLQRVVDAPVGADPRAGDEARARDARWAAFARAYGEHVALEEAQAFPSFATGLEGDSAGREAMGEDMARRRGAVRP